MIEVEVKTTVVKIIEEVNGVDKGESNPVKELNKLKELDKEKIIYKIIIKYKRCINKSTLIYLRNLYIR